MALFAVIEGENGMQVGQYSDTEQPEDAARRLGGVIVDPGPYRSYEDAYDALLALQFPDEGHSDLPETPVGPDD